MKLSVLLALLFCAVLIVAQSQPATPAASADSGPVHISPEAAEALAEKKVPAVYPEKARTSGTQGAVVLDILVSEKGDVKTAAAASGDSDLVQAAIDSIKQWKYKPYTIDGKAQEFQTQVTFGFHIKALPVQPSAAVPDATAPPQPDNSNHEEAAAPSPKGAVMRIRVSSGINRAMLLKKVEPVYPQEAKDAHVQGAVVLHVIIDVEGNVTGVKPVAGPQELLSSAADAVRQWKYRPYLLNGQAIEVDTTVEIKYQLGQ
jgi:TonB family protein